VDGTTVGVDVDGVTVGVHDGKFEEGDTLG
jgi:hypothetical protein